MFFLQTDVEASGNNNGSVGGYRGNGYNPNFENVDEFPPSQQHVQLSPRPAIDLSKFPSLLHRFEYTLLVKLISAAAEIFFVFYATAEYFLVLQNVFSFI